MLSLLKSSFLSPFHRKLVCFYWGCWGLWWFGLFGQVNFRILSKENVRKPYGLFSISTMLCVDVRPFYQLFDRFQSILSLMMAFLERFILNYDKPLWKYSFRHFQSKTVRSKGIFSHIYRVYSFHRKRNFSYGMRICIHIAIIERYPTWFWLF